jgi:glycerophosphoryl diester phosphodiesterase
MNLPPKIIHWLQFTVAAYYGRHRTPFPEQEALKACRIVSHRGEHDNRRVPENTLPAFDRVRDAGAWGIEFDIRWTRDLRPVVIHDPDLKRVFGAGLVVGQTALAELKERYPLIPTLEEVVRRYGKKLHLMVEIKAENYPRPQEQNRKFLDILSALSPCTDYHLMSLTPKVFSIFDALPPEVFLPIAEINTAPMSRLALRQGYGGLTGHFVLINRGKIDIHHAAGQKIGTGFVDSKNCLYRELNRGVDFIFSNRAVELQGICNEMMHSLL